VVNDVDALVGLLEKVEHPIAVTIGMETMAFNSSRRFIDSSFLSSEREELYCLTRSHRNYQSATSFLVFCPAFYRAELCTSQIPKAL
jgi:hypothetical protein